MLYGFLFADSADEAVARLRAEMPEEGLELLEVTGKVFVTTIPEWTDFVSSRFNWIKDALPTAAQMSDSNRSVIHYSPKITRL